MPITSITTPLDLAIQTAKDVEAVLVDRISDTQAHFELDALLPDGSRMVIQLLVEVANDVYLNVSEKVPVVLPSGCPQRHINYDGTFCLGWSGVQDLKVLDYDSAFEWWKLIFAFLIKQRRATKTRRWPGDEWAHGHPAAASQSIVEEAAKILGDDFVTDFKLKKFHVVKVDHRKRPSSLLKVFRNNIHIYSVWEAFKLLTNSKVPCLCISGNKRRPKKIKSCGNHRQALMDLGIHLHNKETEERKFMETYSTVKSCCGTLDDCPIKKMEEKI